MYMTLVKELLESVLRFYRRLLVKKNPEFDNIVNTLDDEGIYVEPGFLTPEQCQLYIDKIESHIASGECSIWVDDEGADNRIYFINSIDENFDEYYKNEKIRSVLRNYTGTSDPKGMLLAAKIVYKEGNVGSGGGWHRDSPVTHQFKTVCYLNDVDETNGPFQYIRGSHRKSDVIRSYLSKVFNAGQYRFRDTEVESYITSNNRHIDSITGNAGTLVYADTKGLHRGKPLEAGTRYVLFCYFWHDSIPAQFESLMQVK
jgi:hypothetical protein